MIPTLQSLLDLVEHIGNVRRWELMYEISLHNIERMGWNDKGQL